ncbi:MAG: DUF4917 family protein [Cyanobacteria bacterium MAG CAR1_bin_15]|nr:DUF4917 family protein [Cyanobacteria bacterium MAG CAR1_bin_15]
MSEDIQVINYHQVLEELESTNQCSHLLLGNGFNVSLGILTDYKSIFEKMIKEESVYQTIKLQMEEQNHDIEQLIGKLKDCLKAELNLTNFLSSYIENKVKFDFMKSASSIVREKVKNIYQYKNKEIHLLFRNFSNYFTLNYDTFLYLILMKFKKSNLSPSKAIAFQTSLKFKQQHLNETQSNIYREIREARSNGKITTEINSQTWESDLNTAKKSLFQNRIENYRDQSSKNWRNKDIKVVCDQIWEEENSEHKLNDINDGFQYDLFQDSQNDQNIFFLHGSFHLYEDGKNIKKITQKKNKAVYECLEEIIHASEKDIICIFTNKSDSKMNQIKANQYLSKCFSKLSSLSGNLVILGSSLNDNDKHIFDAINQSKIYRIYISSSNSDSGKLKTFQKAKNFFPGKDLILFDYRTISYCNTN